MIPLVALLAALAAGAPPTTEGADVSQIPNPPPRNLDADQVPTARRQGEALSGYATGAAQVSTGVPTARGAPDISTPAQGRQAPPATALNGTDICADPHMSAQARQVCDRSLERRAAEFARPTAPQMSSEQKLLIQQQTGLLSADQAARQLGASRSDPSEAALAIAGAISLGAKPKPEDQQPPESGPKDPKIQTILEGVLAGTPH